nr:hypothetical protein [uncultured Devosia sp.]
MTELNSVFERRFSARLLADLTDDVADAYHKSPLGPHDYKTARVVRALGGADINDKEVVISLGDNGPWGIGRISLGKPGNFAPLPNTFNSYEDALRGVFSLRRQAFLARSGSVNEVRPSEELGNKP